MASPWYRLVASLFRSVYYRRISILSTCNEPFGGATLYVALHRNGAVDGYVYMKHASRANFMLASQLRRNAFIRLFFEGVEVVRDKDGGDQSDNVGSLETCVGMLARGEPLLIFPEGSSDLGCRHLPFKKGAARIADAFVETGRSLRVVPLALHYQAAWAWQSDVDLMVAAGFEIAGEMLGDNPARARRRRAIHTRVTAALEAIAVEAPDADSFANWERLACAATLHAPIPYAAALAMLARDAQGARAIGARLDVLIERHRPWLFQGVPLVSTHPVSDSLRLALCLPFAILMAGLNIPVLVPAWWSGRFLADDRNVIAFWRFVIGAPFLALWAGCIVASSVWIGRPEWILFWAASSAGGVATMQCVRKLAVQLGNTLFRRRMRAELEQVCQQLSDWVMHDKP